MLLLKDIELMEGKKVTGGYTVRAPENQSYFHVEKTLQPSFSRQ